MQKSPIAMDALDINLNAILIDSEARSCLFVFSMLGYSL